MTSHKRFWRASAAPLAAALIGLGASNANALSLGKVRVQSALGQSLVAEIDIADLNEDDAKSLKSALASPSAFAGMGLEYNPALNGTQIALQRRPNGNRYLKLVNNRPLNDPFIDLVVELSWASGRIVRTYTILLDPPKAQESATAPLLPAQVNESPVVAALPSAVTTTPVAQPTPAASSPTPSAAAASVVAKPTATPSINPPATVLAERKRVRVRSGDTAGKIARSMAPEGVSLEQMLVAMLNTSPAAFAGGNVNRLLTNTEILAPDTALVKKTTANDARQIIDRQNQEFQILRRSLASQAPAAPAPTKQAEAIGTVSPPPTTSAPKAVPSDTLKLSKGTVQDKADKASMEQIAQQRAKTEASERASELAKNIEELNQLAKVAAKPEAAAPVAPVSRPADAVASPASAAAKSAGTGPAIAATLPAAPAWSNRDLIDSALQNPAVSGLLLALLGALGGLGWYRKKQQKSALATKEGRGQWDAGASTAFEIGGGRRVDTTEASTTGLSTTMYPDSQLEMANELDPVAEAEVYLAYGKDVPAEEILKEGLQQDPTRVAIHLKLLGIFAKRGDAKSFESMAHEVSALVQASGPDWAQVQEMGRSLAPSNPLYGVPAAPATPTDPVDASDPASFAQSMFSLDAESLQALSTSPAAPAAAVAKNEALQQELITQSLFPRHDEPAPAASTAPTMGAETGFDFDSISLEPPVSAQAPAASSIDRLDATLALAEQFLEIGEKEGARALLEEVIAGGNESLRQRATSLLAKAG